MSEIVRLTLVSHAMTDAMSAGRFPADEPVNDLGRRQACAAGDLGPADRVLCGPEQRVRQTAELLGLVARTDVRLADLDHGRWAGRPLEGVAAAELADWMRDPVQAPHGGESVLALLDRVRDWLDSLTTDPARVLAVTHPAVLRAAVLIALDSPPKSFWCIDIEPLSRTVLQHRAGRWRLRCR